MESLGFKLVVAVRGFDFIDLGERLISSLSGSCILEQILFVFDSFPFNFL